MEHLPARLLTVGHGTLDEDAFAALLRGVGVEVVVDVRRFPSSRFNPQFNRGVMEAWLPARGVTYRWEERLGGRREPVPAGPHSALDPDWAGYAEAMATTSWRGALDEVLAVATSVTVAVACAESVPWACHRRFIADAAVLLRGVAVDHLLHDGSTEPHAPNAAARVAGDRLVYDRVAQPRLF